MAISDQSTDNAFGPRRLGVTSDSKQTAVIKDGSRSRSALQVTRMPVSRSWSRLMPITVHRGDRSTPVTPAAVPEPGTMALVLMAAGAAG